MLLEFYRIVNKFEPDLTRFYNEHMRWNLLTYVLNDPYEWKRLNIQTFPAVYPTMIIKAPVPWHATYCLAQQLVLRHLYIGNPVLLKIRDLWENKFVLYKSN